MGKNSAATRQRILEAAVAEFAEHGVAGARVDRIAAAAGSNKQLIYQYFGGKEKLFLAVLAQELARASEGVELEVDDLERYAGAYFDFALANPRLMRLIAWCGLEVRGEVAGLPPAESKVALIAAAQRRGVVADRFPAEFILATIATACTAWVPSNWYANRLDPAAARDDARHRASVVRLIGLMVRPDPEPEP